MSTGSTYIQLFSVRANSTSYLIADDNVTPKSVVLDSAGTEVTTLSKSIFSATSYGTPSSSLALCAVADGTTIQQFNGTAFAAIAYSGTNPTGPLVAIQPTDNRVVNCDLGNRVRFSDAGDYLTWGANNYVDLTPGDGERITSLVTWGNLLFAFKQTKFFVFYGNSVDTAGNPVFNYRTVTGIGSASSAAVTGAIAAPDGVYFQAPDATSGVIPGVYKTTGDTPVRVTRPIDNAFRTTSSLYYPPYLTANQLTAPGGLGYVDGRIYATYNSASLSGYVLLAYDIARDQCWIHRPAATTVYGQTSFVRSGGPSGEMFFVTNGTKIYRTGYGTTTDDGTAISALYRTGYADLGLPAREKIIRESVLTGSGTPSVQISSDYRALDTAGAVTLGTAPAVAQGRRRVANKGTVFSTALSSSSGQWSVNQIVHNLRNTRASGLKAT
jgi:hypothetical protein